MRVIAGSHRGRRLSAAQGRSLRPTSDKVRGALFSILGPRVSGSRFLDLYAGTGAVGIEALSRGAIVVTFVESDPTAMQVLHNNLTTCGLLEQAELRREPAEQFLRQRQWQHAPYEIVFADPPYADPQAVELVLGGWTIGLLTPDAVMVIEQDARAELPAATNDARFTRRYRYGDTALLLYGSAPRGLPS
ncbi:MAG: putative Ribosomal small subunit methyltransferase [Nitrospira sp.]|nr:putative Ribosomal small subunit methyltransferase [Nitrospira sp.]